MTGPTHRGVHDRLMEVPPPGSAKVADPKKTLPLRIELTRQILRRRTQIVAALLTVLPLLVAIAFKVGGAPSADRRGPELVSVANHGAANFTLFVEFAAQGFLMVVVVALFCGDTVAGEANWSSLRYLLTAPVPRWRLLRQKLIVALGLSVAANLWLPVVSFGLGGLFFGWAPARTPLGQTFAGWAAFDRLAIVVGYACVQALVVAALAFLLSVVTDAPLGAVGGAVLLIVISNILDQITALDPYRKFLPTHFQYSWLDALSSPIGWDDMIRGSGLAVVFAAAFLGLAWWYFERKDITS